MKRAAKLFWPLLAALLMTVLAAGPLRRVDKWMQDWLCQQPGVPSGDIVVIGIDEEAFSLIGPYSTWDRTVMAAALEALAADPENRPAVTAIDVLYAGRTSEAADRRLAQAAASLGNVVTAAAADFGEVVTWEDGHAASVNRFAVRSFEAPYDELAQNSFPSHINAMTDRDGVLRHALLYVDNGEERVYSMAAEAARLFLESRGETLTLPDVNAHGFFYVPFTAGPGGYSDGVSIASLIQGNIPPQYWAGKIVLIGPYAAALQDAYFTSIDKGAQMYGVEFQANVLQSLLDRNFKTEVPDGPQLIVLFAVCAAAMAFYLSKRAAVGGALCAALTLLGALCPAILYRAGFVIHPLWIPAGVLLLYIPALIFHYRRAAAEKQALALENERIGAELALASRIQENALPQNTLERPEFSLAASMKPAREVGGDFYDFFLIDDDQLAIVIADVSGKGIPAALFMMVSSSLIHHALSGGLSPAKTLETVNRQLTERNPEEMFVTVWAGVLDLSDGVLRAANAGHEYPVLQKPDGHFELVRDRHGFVLGGMEGMKYREYELLLEPGARLFVYTDGVPEAADEGEKLFGTDRLLTALHEAENGTPEDVLHKVEESVHAFVGNAAQFDDLTMLCVQFHGRSTV